MLAELELLLSWILADCRLQTHVPAVDLELSPFTVIGPKTQKIFPE